MAVGSVCLNIIGTFKEKEMQLVKCVKLDGTHCLHIFTHQVIIIQVEIYSPVGFLHIWVAYFWSN